jgi:hypothetical protein
LTVQGELPITRAMDQRKDPWYLNVWLRVGLFIPGLYVLPWALLALAPAPEADTDKDDLIWGCS